MVHGERKSHLGARARARKRAHGRAPYKRINAARRIIGIRARNVGLGEGGDTRTDEEGGRADISDRVDPVDPAR